MLKRLKHPNVLNFMGLLLDKDNQMCFLVGMLSSFIFFVSHLMSFSICACFFYSKDYIAGGTLKNIIHELSIPLTWLKRLRYAKDIAAGMVKKKKILISCFTINNLF